MRKIRIISTIGIVLTIGFIVFYIIELQKVNIKNFTFQPMVVAQYEYSNYNEYFALKNGIYRVTKNGVSKILEDGSIEWNKSFNLSKPAVYESDSFFVVCDLEGYQFYVFNQSGFLYEKKVERQIIKGDINQNGHVTLVTAKGDLFSVQAFRENGDLILTRDMYYKTEGFPMFANLSDDSLNLVIGTTIGVGEKIQSTLIFMNLGPYGQTLTDDITGIIPFDNTIIGSGDFIDDTHFFAVGQNKLVAISLSPNPSIEKTIDIGNRIQKVAYNQLGAYIYYGDSFEYTENDLSNKIVCYSAVGKKMFEIKPKQNVKWMLGTKDYLLVTTDQDFEIYQNNRQIREYVLDKELLGVYGIQNNKYLFVYYNEYVIGKFEESRSKKNE